MKALVKAKEAMGIWMADVPRPDIGPNDLLIKIKKTAICGTDIHIYQWDEWAKAHIKAPLVIGHEFAGEVVAIGAEVESHFNIGDRVSGEGHIACRHCRNCRTGRAHLCRSNVSVGVTRNGCFAEYLALPASNAYKLPDDISDNIGAILDPLGNATHSALSFDLVGEDVLITGAGPVGILAAVIAQHVGARHVVITDVNPYRLTLAARLGIKHTINPLQTDLQQVMTTLNMQEGFDVGLEMSGNANAFNQMLTHMNHAGKMALLGFLPHDTQIDWSNLIMRGLTVKGIYGREMYQTWYKMIMMLQSGLAVNDIITHEFHCDDYQQAFDVMRSGESGKVILRWD